MFRSKLSYLNFILTIIAISLTIIVLQNSNIIPTAKAEMKLKLPSEMDVRVTNTVDVNVEKVGGSSTYGTIKVKNQ